MIWGLDRSLQLPEGTNFLKKDERERERANFQSVTMILNECFESLIIMITFPFRIVEAAAMDLAYDSVLLVETHLILLYH